jgi:organic radical activating enzyme
MSVWKKYRNGNYTVKFNTANGTKIRETEEDDFIAQFPENMDVKITNQCDMGCIFCHEDSKIDGLHGDIINPKFINSLHPYTEMAIGGGNPLSHPDLIPFLERLKSRHIIANMTVNQVHFETNQELIKELVDDGLIHGLGVSLVDASKEFVEHIKQYPNAVIHVINGIVKLSDIEVLKDNDLKMLILGYKEFRRGIGWYGIRKDDITNKQNWLNENLADIVNQFKVVSFDNLAIEQLNVKQLMSKEDWNEFYMGDDGMYTFFIDLVENKFARCSISETRYDLLDNVEDMFNIVKKELTDIK